MDSLNLTEQTNIWTHIWNSGIYSSQKAYAHLIGTRQVHPAFSWLWKSCSQNKRKVFFWLLMWDRLSTRNLLRRKNMFLEDYNCVVCSLCTEETLLHLFVNSPFAEQCWNTLGLTVQNYADPLDTIASFRIQLGLPFSMEIIISMSWAIWSVRNEAIFRNVQPSIQNAKRHFWSEFAQVILRAKKSYEPAISQWLEDYV